VVTPFCTKPLMLRAAVCAPAPPSCRRYCLVQVPVTGSRVHLLMPPAVEATALSSATYSVSGSAKKKS
jgi:hypothetical protein